MDTSVSVEVFAFEGKRLPGQSLTITPFSSMN